MVPALLQRTLERLVDVRGSEGPAVAWSFVFFFSLLTAYSLLKPVRDEMAIAGDIGYLHWLFTATFGGSVMAVPLYSWLAARVPRRRLVSYVYRICAATLLVFFGLLRTDVAPAAVARVFFVWVSVFNLFITSLFWAFLADVFASSQGKRLFGLVAAGGTAGAILGPLLAASLAPLVGPAALLVISAAVFEVAARCAGRVGRWASSHGSGAGDERPVGGSPFAGFTLLARSPFLLALGGQTLLFAITSTLLYAQYLKLVEGAIADPAWRVALFGYVDAGGQALTLVLQLFASGRILSRFGLGAGLSLQPALSVVGLGAVALVPFLGPMIVLWAARRGAHYAIERPAREVLFTSVDREARYKAKSSIDTVVYRGGDALSGWLNAGLVAAGLGAGGVALAAVPFAAGGIWIAVHLARRHERAVGEEGR